MQNSLNHVHRFSVQFRPSCRWRKQIGVLSAYMFIHDIVLRCVVFLLCRCHAISGSWYEHGADFRCSSVDCLYVACCLRFLQGRLKTETVALFLGSREQEHQTGRHALRSKGSADSSWTSESHNPRHMHPGPIKLDMIRFQGKHRGFIQAKHAGDMYKHGSMRWLSNNVDGDGGCIEQNMQEVCTRCNDGTKTKLRV